MVPITCQLIVEIPTSRFEADVNVRAEYAPVQQTMSIFCLHFIQPSATTPAPSMAQIRVGFIGLSASGWAAKALFPSFQVPSVRSSFAITALCTSSAASASTAVALYEEQVGSPIKAYHGSDGISQLVRDPEVDLVVVSVKAPSHKEPVLAAIEAGKDVFVEWPAGATLEETVEMEKHAKAKGVKVIVGLQGRHSATTKVVRVMLSLRMSPPSTRGLKIKDTIESGKLGKVLSSTIMGSMSRDSLYWGPQIGERSAYVYQPRSGATFAEIIIGHQLDTFTHVLGSFSTVSATSTIIYPTATVVDSKSTPPPTVHATAPDHVALTGILTSGALVSMIYRAGYESTPGRTEFLWEIDCEKGSIRVEAPPTSGPLSHLMNIHDLSVYVCGEKVEFEGSGLLGNLAASWIGYLKEKRVPDPGVDELGAPIIMESYGGVYLAILPE
ncbi:transcription regulator gal80 [Pleurotus pulmonarius]|nr:transcription regulator gal80 [Pleurotus pulmonarius]